MSLGEFLADLSLLLIIGGVVVLGAYGHYRIHRHFHPKSNP